MSELKATPGPWRITNSGPEGHHFKIQIGTHERTVAYAWCPRGSSASRIDETTANAHLIAAAPELYDETMAGKKLLGELVAWALDVAPRDLIDRIADYHDSSDAALKRARGEA